MFKSIGVLTSASSWMAQASKSFVLKLEALGYSSHFYSDHRQVSEDCEVLFILSYFTIIPESYLLSHKHNLVIHESALPQGRGWAPLFWQILEGKNEIPISLIEAGAEYDSGEIYLQDKICFNGFELHDEIRQAQADKTFEMCLKFLTDYEGIKGRAQTGVPTFYKRRGPNDSQLDINKSIGEQFNQLRIADNFNYPAFFVIDGSRYDIRISRHQNLEPRTSTP